VLRAAAQAGAAAIVYDVLLTERSPEDAALAGAILGAPTFLPLLTVRGRRDDARAVVLPAAPFVNAAAGTGYVNLKADSDGVVRRVALFEDAAGTREPYIGISILRAIRAGTLPLAGERYFAHGHGDPIPVSHGDARVLVPFSAGAPTRVSSAQLLAGNVPPGALRGKVVFVGVTAASVDGYFATRVSGHIQPMSDLAMHAQIFSALLGGHIARAASTAVTLAASLVPLAILLAGFFVLSPRRSLALIGALCIVVLAVSVIALHSAGIWISPAPVLVALVALYPLWSRRRLGMTMSRLREELRQLDDDAHLLFAPLVTAPGLGGDGFERQIALVERAAQRLQYMKHFAWDSLNSMPEPVMVADRDGIVLLANQAARAQFVQLGSPEPTGRALVEVLGDFSLSKLIDSEPEVEAFVRAEWPAILDPTGKYVKVVKRGLEVRDRTGREYLLRYKRCRNERGEESGSWVAGLVEVTARHAAERGCEDTLQFLSHDMRSRHASILALINLERSNTESKSARVFLERIERHTQRALKLADDFVQLARAESQTYSLEPINLTDIVLDASDEVWPQAQAKRIRVEMRLEGNEHWVAADRSLITRAVTNVVNNAVKYSPTDTVIQVSVSSETPRRVRCSVRDEGYGIPQNMQMYLFEPFRRFQSPGQPATNGIGLGMAFVRAVVLRHGGEVEVESEPGKGTTVTIGLPALAGMRITVAH
jgi:signal transduction histidine kinase